MCGYRLRGTIQSAHTTHTPKRGIKLEHQYDWLPYQQDGGVFVEAVVVDSVRAMVTTYYNVIVIRLAFDRHMLPEDVLDPDNEINFL